MEAEGVDLPRDCGGRGERAVALAQPVANPVLPSLVPVCHLGLDHGLSGPGRSDRVGVAVDDLPGAVFGAQHARHPERARSHLRSATTFASNRSTSTR